jgi:hypothetical protein
MSIGGLRTSARGAVRKAGGLVRRVRDVAGRAGNTRKRATASGDRRLGAVGRRVRRLRWVDQSSRLRGNGDGEGGLGAILSNGVGLCLADVARLRGNGDSHGDCSRAFCWGRDDRRLGSCRSNNWRLGSRSRMDDNLSNIGSRVVGGS